MRKLFFITLTGILIFILLFFLLRPGMTDSSCMLRAVEAKEYCRKHKLNSNICVFVDYSLHSGVNRLVIWSLKENKSLYSCLVSHGRGQGEITNSSSTAKLFSNVPESKLSSLGKGRIGERYKGSYGISYRLDGLEKSNSNMRKRAIVLHGWRVVKDYQPYPRSTRAGYGCPAVSHKSMSAIDTYLRKEKNVLIWIYN